MPGKAGPSLPRSPTASSATAMSSSPRASPGDRLAAIIRDLGIEDPDFGVTLLVGGHPVALTGFVSSFLSGAVKGMVAELKGIADDAGEIELYITRV